MQHAAPLTCTCHGRGCDYCRPYRLATAAETPAAGRVVMPATVEGVDTEARTISGMIVPFGQAGATSQGRLTFSAGSLQVSDPKRIKLLVEHDQRHAVGHAVSIEERPNGLFGVFTVPETEAGNTALAEAALGLRDAFSVGVQLDDATQHRLRRSQGAPVAAAGQLRETSLVSVPAFDDARLAAAAGADLVVSGWTTASNTPTSPAGAAGTTTQKGTTMKLTDEQRRRLAALRAQDTLTQDEAAELSQLAGIESAEAEGTGTETAQQGTEQASAAASSGGIARPAVVPAVAGAATITGAPSTYTFSEGSPSLVTDLARGALEQDSEARERVARFNAELRDQNPASIHAFMTAAATRDDYDGSGNAIPEAVVPSPRPILKPMIDAKRPLISRLATVPISNAQPFPIPGVEVEFDGVGDHTEGTPHRPAGTLTMAGGSIAQPTATSGAWEVSRELLDASNPVLDRVAARAMLNDYRRKSEGKVTSLLVARAAQEGSTVYGVDSVLGMRAAMLDFVNEDEEGADLVVVSKGLLSTLGLDTDTTDRPQLPFVGAVNAAGTMRAGYTGVAIDGVEVTRSARLDGSLGIAATPTGHTGNGDAGVIARSEGILWGESPVLQFRFDEVLGPGVIKLALWAYTVAAIIDVADVKILRAGADPTP